jgi:hypothetical protein
MTEKIEIKGNQNPLNIVLSIKSQLIPYCSTFLDFSLTQMIRSGYGDSIGAL